MVEETTVVATQAPVPEKKKGLMGVSQHVRLVVDVQGSFSSMFKGSDGESN